MEEVINFTNKSGNKIVGILTKAASKDTVILCHGLSSHKNGFHLPALAKALALEGVSSLRLDLSGNGESEGNFKYANQAEEADDIEAATRFLATREYTPLGLLGHSKSGSSVLLYSAKYGGIPRVVNTSGRFDHKTGIKERFGDDVFERVEREGGVPLTWNLPEVGEVNWVFDRQDLEERMSIDMAAICQEIPQSVSVLTIHGTVDATIPVQDARRFAELLPGHRLVEIEGGDHNFRRPEHRDALIKAAVQFLVHGTC